MGCKVPEDHSHQQLISTSAFFQKEWKNLKLQVGCKVPEYHSDQQIILISPVFQKE